MELILFIVTVLPMLGALLLGCCHKLSDDFKANMANVIGVIEFVLCAILLFQVIQGNSIAFEIKHVCGLGISLKLDGFRALHAGIAAFMWMMTTIFTKEYLHHYQHKLRYMFFTLITCGATVGVFLSADLMTTFIYFEIMSIASYVMVAHDQTTDALRAAETYLAVAVIGGMVMLMGLFLLYSQTHTLVISELFEACEHVQNQAMLFISGCLILVGFGAKAGMFPLHIWLPKTYPVAPAPASALLSGILTKTGVYGVIIISMEMFRENTTWAYIILMIGVITMLLGAILAVFSTNLKRTLACSSMSQIGFISVGIAMSIFLGHHNALAARGTILHMVNHSLIKLLLFMIAGVIYMNLHQLDLNKIQGYGRKKTLLKVLYLVGALGISGVPLFNGYVSKTLIHESIVEYIVLASNPVFFETIEWLFIIAGGLTFAYMTKLFICIFVEKNQDAQLQNKYDANTSYMNNTSGIVLIICAICLILIGVIPNITADYLAHLSEGFLHAGHLEHAVHYFSMVNLVGGAKSLIIGAFVYVVIIRGLLMKGTVYLQRWPQLLDLENLFYRPLIQQVIPFMVAFICRVLASIPEFIVYLGSKSVLKKIKVKKPEQQDYLPGQVQTFPKSSMLLTEIEASLSFGLLLFGMGVIITVLYILFF